MEKTKYLPLVAPLGSLGKWFFTSRAIFLDSSAFLSTVSPGHVISKLTLVSIALALVACSTFAEQRSWLFMQSVGGIEVGTPLQSETGWLLPVRSDVSGLRTITAKPSTLNSGLSCQRIEAEIEGDAIFITIFTGVAGGGRSSVCPSVLLGHLPAGKYSVFYRSLNEIPVSIGEVSIGF
jgi:hypothetical protein